MTEATMLLDGPRATYGRYRVLHQIGAGSLGPVFRGEDPDSHRPVVINAIRVALAPDQIAIVATSLAWLQDRLPAHPALCPMLDTGVDGSEPYVVWAFVVGYSLDAALREYGPANISDALPRLCALAEAIDAAAAAGVVHGSLHPRDIIVSPEHTVLTGIGMASVLERVGVQPPVRRPYCAPELGNGQGLAPAADQYALAAIAHEWLSGRPIAGPGAEGLFLPATSADVTEVPVAVFARALDPLPEARFPTATAFVDALAEIADALAPRSPLGVRRAAPVESPPLAVEPSDGADHDTVAVALALPPAPPSPLAAPDHEDPISAVDAPFEWSDPEDAVTAPPIGTSPAQRPGPSGTLAPAPVAMNLPSATPEVNGRWTAKDARGGYPAPFDWVKHARRAALVCSVLAVAAVGILVLQMPATPPPAVAPSEPAIEPPEIEAPVDLDSRTPLARPDPAFSAEVADPPSVPPLAVRSAPRGAPRVEDQKVPATRAKDSLVRSVPPPASLPGPSAAAAVVAPDAGNSAGAPLPAVGLPSVVASPSPSPIPIPSPGPTASPSPAEASGSASTKVGADAVARFPGREQEARAIETVLGRYRIALNELNAGAALAVWPTVNEKTLARAFERLESHHVSFESCQIEIFSVLAEASCIGSARYVPKVGSRTPKDEARRWKFSLRKATGGWLIDRVDAR